MICLNLKTKELWLMLEAKVIILSWNCLFLPSLFLLDTIMENQPSCEIDNGNDFCSKSCFQFSNCILDVPMASPPTSPSHNLQGASRITGGVFRGRAYGNVFNLADSRDLEIAAASPVMGKVYLYDSCVDPAKTKPKSAFKLKVTTSLGVVLSKLAEKDSPVRRKLLFNYSSGICFSDFLGLNPRIFVYEEDLWNIKGRYSTAIKDEEPVTWDFINGEYILPISVVGYTLFCLEKI
jgi:hypothetical protein